MARKVIKIQDDVVAMFQMGRESRLQNKRRIDMSRLSQSERQAFHDGWSYEEQALRTGDAPETPMEYQQEYAR